MGMGDEKRVQWQPGMTSVARPLPCLPPSSHSGLNEATLTQQASQHAEAAAIGQRVVLLPSLPNRWRKVRRVLAKMEEAGDVWAALDQVATLAPMSKGRSNPVSEGLQAYHDSRSSVANQSSLLATLRAVALFARGVDARLRGGRLPVLRCGQSAVVSVDRQLAADLLAHVFLCLTRGRDACSFGRVMETMGSRVQGEKVKCMLTYFTRLQEEHMSGYTQLHGQHITLERVSLTDQHTLSWSQLRSSTKCLCKLTFNHDTLIEDTSTDYAKVIFVNGKRIRGKALTASNTFGQQEIRCAICPELLLADMLAEPLADSDALIIKGFERYSRYEGEDHTFRFNGRYRDKCAGANVAIALRAQCYVDNTQRQYQRMHMLRDINTAFAGFCRFPSINSSTASNSSQPLPQCVATGNWGCGGSQGGDPQLKTIVQWVAASEAGCEELLYCSRGDSKLHTLAANIHQLTFVYKTVGDLVQMLERCEQQVIGNFLSQQMTKLTHHQRHLPLSGQSHASTASRTGGCVIS